MLVDSEPISCRVHAAVLSCHGYPITAEDVRRRFLGRSTRDCHGEIEAELGHALPEAYHRDLGLTLLAALEQEVTAAPHIEAALDALTVPTCVASSGGHDKIFATLSRTGLHARFAPHIFSASEVAHGKPAPDLFLFAAGRMGCRPEDCLVVEDSAAGVSAARAAGMAVVGYVGGSHCRPEDAARLASTGALTVIDDMRELPALVSRHFALHGTSPCPAP